MADLEYRLNTLLSGLVDCIEDECEDVERTTSLIVDGDNLLANQKQRLDHFKKIFEGYVEQALAMLPQSSVAVSADKELTLKSDRNYVCNNVKEYLRDVYRRGGIEVVVNHIAAGGVKKSEAQRGFPDLYATHFSDRGTGCLKLYKRTRKN